MLATLARRLITFASLLAIARDTQVAVSKCLYYYLARFYGEQTGRFLTEDRIGVTGVSNLYSYVLDDPTGFVDPTGLSAASTILNLFGGAAGNKLLNQSPSWGFASAAA